MFLSILHTVLIMSFEYTKQNCKTIYLQNEKVMKSSLKTEPTLIVAVTKSWYRSPEVDISEIYRANKKKSVFFLKFNKKRLQNLLSLQNNRIYICNRSYSMVKTIYE